MPTDETPTVIRKYPDSPAGCRQMLEDNFTFNLTHATYTADPVVHGVWLVTQLNGAQIIAYMAGHRDPWGNEREANDAEYDEHALGVDDDATGYATSHAFA